MRSPWTIIGFKTMNHELSLASTINPSGRALSVTFDNYISVTSVEFKILFDAGSGSSKTIYIDIRGGSIFESGVQKLKLITSSRTEIWQKEIHGKTMFNIPIRLTAKPAGLIFCLEIENGTDNQLSIDTMDIATSRRVVQKKPK